MFFHSHSTAICSIAEASKSRRATGKKPGPKDIGAPMEQTLFDFQFDVPFEQTGSSVAVVASSSSESSEVDSDMDMDTDTDVDTADSPNGVANGGNQQQFQPGGVIPPNARNQGRSGLSGASSRSGQKAGIAFAVLALIGVAVAGTVFAYRKYRPVLPFISQV